MSRNPSIECRVTRGDHVESRHIAYAVMVDADGDVLWSAGDPDYVTCIRSALKPFQAAASVLAGAVDAAGFTDRELALMCASHNGEKAHTETAQAMLKKLGFSVNVYEFGTHPPYDRSTRNTLVRSGQSFTPFHNNCSGKHAGMLALAQHLRANPAGYTSQTHPVQTTIFDYVHKLLGVQPAGMSIDGCSAPTPFLSLRDIARLFQKLVAQDTGELQRIYQAMTLHPYLVAGRNRFDTDFLSALNGRGVTKVGGESVRGVGLRLENGKTVGLAVKVLDGHPRANPVATMALLTHLRLLTENERDRLNDYKMKSLTNHRRISIGSISANVLDRSDY